MLDDVTTCTLCTLFLVRAALLKDIARPVLCQCKAERAYEVPLLKETQGV